MSVRADRQVCRRATLLITNNKIILQTLFLRVILLLMEPSRSPRKDLSTAKGDLAEKNLLAVMVLVLL
jgi:hypothetical protein